MPQNSWKQFLTLDGRLTRLPYFLTGVVLLNLKFFIDQAVAGAFGKHWLFFFYFIPPSSTTLDDYGPRSHTMYAVLWAITIPFFWIGLSFTIRRLRDAGHRLGWIALFFVPIVNLAFFAWLSLTPSTAAPIPAPTEQPYPRHANRQPFLAIAIAALLGLALTRLSADVLFQYSWGLFLAVPFITGFTASWIFNRRNLHSAWQTTGIVVLVPIVIGVGLLALRWEGAVCLLMALPLAAPFCIAGGLVAHQMLRRHTHALSPPRFASFVALVPVMMFAEHAARLEPPVRPVVTRIIVNAPAAIVWKNVIQFPPLAPPTELMFRSGIAYPIGATITGTGPGAIRRCRFSTGDFVEPITVWDENHLLAFSVTSQPPSMREIGFGTISTPHIDRNYMRSQHGQFRLVAIDDLHTLLEGTTWYQDYFWPQFYWRALSDAIVHRIHLRVLEHVKAQAETQATAP